MRKVLGAFSVLMFTAITPASACGGYYGYGYGCGCPGYGYAPAYYAAPVYYARPAYAYYAPAYYGRPYYTHSWDYRARSVYRGWGHRRW